MSATLADELVESVRRHAETVLEHGRDRYGDERTPLLADAVDAGTLDAVPYDARDVDDGRRLSNFAVQQEFLRTAVGLARLTGATEYRDEAAALATWVLENLTDDAGLPYWGGHAAYDLDADEVAINKDAHELKFEYPFYEFLWAVDPERTRRFVEAFWSAHVVDWGRLDFNRHGGWDGAVGDPWDHEYAGGDVFFWGEGLTFVNTGSDLYYAAGLLSSLGDEAGPLTWAERLARRYVETRQEPGLSGYQFSQHPSYCNGPAIRGDRAQYQFAPYIHGDHLVYEGTLFRPRPIVQRQQLALGDRLGRLGESFTRWALEELRAWYEVAYRPDANEFEPMLTDGHSLEGFVCRREGYFGPKGRVVGPIDAGPEFFWTYARASRLTDDPVCWRAARDIGRGLGLGDVGGPDSEPALRAADRADPPDYAILYGLLELHRATDRGEYLEAARTLGDDLLDGRFRESPGAFVDDQGRIQLDDPVPLSLLHLAAAVRGTGAADLPTPVGAPRTPDGGI